MSPRYLASSNPSGKKRQKKVMTLQEKLTLLDMIKEGKSYATVARHYNMNESTVRYIKKKEDEIRMTMAFSFSSSAKTVSTSRDQAIARMESVLVMWISDCQKKNIPLDSNMIREKARSLYNQFSRDNRKAVLKEGDAGPSTSSKSFIASKGWFYRFQERFGLKKKSSKYQEEWKEIFKKVDKMTKSSNEKKDVNVDEPHTTVDEPLVLGMSMDHLSKLFQHINEAKDMAMSWDHCVERSLKFSNAIDAAIEPYKQLFTTLKKQK